jgi:hypothetical protein
MRTLKGIYEMPALRWIGLAILFVGLTGSTCTEDREVQVVVSADIIAQFAATGATNTFSGSNTVALNDEINLQQILDDNGLESIDEVTVQSAFYRVITPDPNTSRTITGQISVHQGANPDQGLVSLTSVLVDDPTYVNWTAVPLLPGGVTVVNAALAQAVAGGFPTLTISTSGTSTPADVPTSFVWEVKIRVNVVGTAKVTVVEPI